ncbi:MAG: MAPEG family protein [Sulfitobacter sp.]
MFEPYSHAIAALVLWALLLQVLGMLSVVGRQAETRCECGKPKRNYADPVYRRERAFMNAVEGSGPFIAVTVAAILSGAVPFAVNLLASLFIVARLCMAFVHIKTENQPMRSMFFVVGLGCVFMLAISAFRAVI